MKELGATGQYVLTGSSVYVGILKKLSEDDHPIHDLDIKLIPDNPLTAVRVLTVMSEITGKEQPMTEYFTIKNEPVRYDFTYNDIPVNVWLMLDPVKYEIVRLDRVYAGASSFMLNVDIPIENLNDILLAKAKMNRPKDVKDLSVIEWNPTSDFIDRKFEDIAHPWVLKEVKSLTQKELQDVFSAEVIIGQFDTKSIQFANRIFANGSECPTLVYQYIDLDTNWDGYNSVKLGHVNDPASIKIAVYNRFKKDACLKLRARIITNR